MRSRLKTKPLEITSKRDRGRGVQEFRSSGVQEFRSSGVQGGAEKKIARQDRLQPAWGIH
jgi:hypothetical protein